MEFITILPYICELAAFIAIAILFTKIDNKYAVGLIIISESVNIIHALYFGNVWSIVTSVFFITVFALGYKYFPD